MTACSVLRIGWRMLFVGAVLGECSITACSSRSPASRDTDSATGAPQASQEVRPEKTAKAVADVSLSLPRAGEDVTKPEPAPVNILYDPKRIIEIELTLDDAAIATLSSPEAVAAKTWVHARLKCGDATFADVGVRVKGASTLRLLPGKASLKVKLNKWVKGQKLDGIEMLTLNNMVSDPTFLAERITYHVFRSLGLPAPHANTAHLRINGEDYGIFSNIETPDENLLERAFGGKARTLYEVNWGSRWLPGKGPDTGFEIEIPALGAPPGSMPDADLLFEAVAAAKDETLLADLAGRLHTKQWLRHSAAEAVTNHCDGYAYSAYGSHNYFLTGDIDGKFSLVPWSTDLSFSNCAGLVDAGTPDAATVFARCRSSTCWDAYKSEVGSVLAIYETLDLVNLARSWHDQIDALVRSDPKRERSIGAYERETANLYDALAARPNVVRAQLGL